MLLSHSDKFTPMDMNSRVFRKTAGSHDRPRSLRPVHPVARRGDLAGLNPIRDWRSVRVLCPDRGHRRRHGRDGQRTGRARRSGCQLGTSAGCCRTSRCPTGRSSCDRIWTKRGRSGKSALIQDVQWQRNGGEPSWYEVHVNPLVDADDKPLGTSIAFFDVTATRKLLTQVSQANQPAGVRLRGAAVHQRRAGDHQRGTAVDGGGTRDHQRRAAVHQRRARDDERGAAVHQRRAAHHQRDPARPQSGTRRHEEVSSTPSSTPSSWG